MSSTGTGCRQCLFREMAESETLQSIRDCLDRMPENEKVPEDIYERRLSVCRECASLNAATCMLCGCYVELRAAFRNAACPHVPGLWKAERIPARRKKVK